MSSPPVQVSRQRPSSSIQEARQEGLACVIDVPACESVAEGPGALAEVSLVEDVERGTILGQEVCHGDACDVDNSVMSTSR